MRTHTCGELRKKDIKKEVVLEGWVQSRRDHGGVIFIDLRDRYGLAQAVFDPSHNKDVHKKAEHLGREFVLRVKGKLRDRKEGMINPNMPTGEVELLADELDILNESETPPMEIDDRKLPNEEVRLKYRYLDLRRPSMQEKIILRHNVVQAVRESLNSRGFLEIETPLLVKPTPEGARDYMVPSRVNPGKVYALPQSPQLYKQILMVSGFDRYYQIARCLRDEDLRADRQPEFTQIDLEMSFPTQEQIFEVIEGTVKHIFEKTKGIKLKTPFERITYHDAMERFGCDKPDMRFGLEIADITDIANKSEFSVFKNVIAKSGKVKCLCVKKCDFSRNKMDELIEFVKTNKAQGMAWAKMQNGKLESSIVKYLNDNVQKEIIAKAKAADGDMLMFVADKPKVVCSALAALRNLLGKELKLYKEDEFKFAWVVDFPLFEYNEDTEKLEPAHHMFTMPNAATIKYLESEPAKVIAECYDLVLNGIELGSGSIRIHRKDIQERVMKAMGIKEAEAEKKFGFLLEAFRYGAPPHGGIALGLDRVCALMTGTNDIREVIAFPKNKAAECPMDSCPSDISDKELKEVHLKWDLVKKQ
ncbi:MAG: aspartate--tRNA ligase [Candidatus Nanoarchaeia archaeon]|nr:aspartate--tRNA ligase [Candidatus Nanoarchaeia archaeon]